MSIYIVAIALFIIALLLIETVIFGFRNWKYPDRRVVKRRLAAESTDLFQDQTVDLLRKQILSEIPAFNMLLPYLPGIRHLSWLVVKANASYTPGFFVLLSAAMLAVFWAFGMLVIKNTWLALLIGAAVSTVPFIFLRIKKDKRSQRKRK